nr:OB-fold domain-containing protein [Desulfonema ishimotonii]
MQPLRNRYLPAQDDLSGVRGDRPGNYRTVRQGDNHDIHDNLRRPLEREVEAPYTIVMVELDEGPWIAGNLIDIDPDKTGMALMGRRVKLGHKLFPGDRYSGGEAARPLFSFED